MPWFCPVSGLTPHIYLFPVNLPKAITSVIKNKTRVIEKKILNLNIKISQKKNNINEAQLDYDYLSSPSEIEKKLNEIGFDNYRPIKHSNIFFNVYDFNNGWIYSWHCMDHVNMKSNPRSKAVTRVIEYQALVIPRNWVHDHRRWNTAWDDDSSINIQWMSWSDTYSGPRWDWEDLTGINEIAIG